MEGEKEGERKDEAYRRREGERVEEKMRMEGKVGWRRGKEAKRKVGEVITHWHGFAHHVLLTGNLQASHTCSKDQTQALYHTADHRGIGSPGLSANLMSPALL